MKKKKKHQRRKHKTSARASKRRAKFKSGKRINKKSTASRRKARKARVVRRKIVKKIVTRKKAKAARIRKTKPQKRRARRKSHSPKAFIRRIVARKSAKKAPASKPTLVLNTDFEFFYELRDLVLKSSPAEKDRMIERLNKLGRIKLAIISGVFINKENLDPLITDLLIVGDDVDRRKLRAFLRATEAEVGKEIKFTVMDKEEFQYRLAMFDRFIRVLLESPHEKLINRLGI
jgi:hypothetical protein